MIVFDRGRRRFNYRIAGVAIDGDRVLLQRADPPGGIWFMPGGRAEMLESSVETLRREMREELGVEVTVGRLLWVVENFFSMDERRYHELSLFLAMTLPPECALMTSGQAHAIVESHATLTTQWHRLTDLEEIALYPVFLRQALRALPENTAHIINIE